MAFELIYRLDNIEGLAQEILKLAGNRKVLAFHGEMGAGKTTVIAAIARVLGTQDVTGSPTFSIINQYLGENGETMFHMDWYRLKNEEEAIDVGVEEALFSGSRCLVEWPDRALALLPGDTLHLYIETVDPKIRRIRAGD